MQNVLRNIAISNIAWSPNEDAQVRDLLVNLGVRGIEVAPTKMWNGIEDTEDDAVRSWRAKWNTKGIQIVALQSLLYGHPELVLFSDEKTKVAAQEYLSKVIRLAVKLGARVLVFGSPKNRVIGDMPRVQAMNRAIDFFRQLGELAHRSGVVFCIEPNSAVYGCDFIRNTEEAIALVRAVSHPGFGLHLDTGVMALNGEDYGRSIERALPYLEHFHISEPYLQSIGSGKVDHSVVANCLRQSHYDKWISIEMRESTGVHVEIVQHSLEYVISTYGQS